MAPSEKHGVRPALRRWTAVAMLLVASTLAVLYVANAIAVNDLMVDITSLERERESVLRTNEALRAELNRLTSVDRITAIAAHDLHMVMPAQPPRVISLTGESSVAEGERTARDGE
jgi:cell division protein FtsL